MECAFFFSLLINFLYPAPSFLFLIINSQQNEIEFLPPCISHILFIVFIQDCKKQSFFFHIHFHTIYDISTATALIVYVHMYGCHAVWIFQKAALISLSIQNRGDHISKQCFTDKRFICSFIHM